MGNRFVNTYEDLKIRATKQNYELVYFSQLFELLKDSQRSWLYLDSIFKAKDIQAINNGSEYNNFNKNSKTWL